SSSAAVLLELPDDLAAAAAAAAAEAPPADPLQQFDTEKLQSLEALLHERLCPLPQWGPPGAPSQAPSRGGPLPSPRTGAPTALLPPRGPPSSFLGPLPNVGGDDLRPPLGPPGLGGPPGAPGGPPGGPWGPAGGGGSLVGPGHPLFGVEGEGGRLV
ncbi:hypothetical protein ETH_00035735, partial [Eimeria tenella]